jgi:hypothetical protein
MNKDPSTRRWPFTGLSVAATLGLLLLLSACPVSNSGNGEPGASQSPAATVAVETTSPASTSTASASPTVTETPSESPIPTASHAPLNVRLSLSTRTPHSGEAVNATTTVTGGNGGTLSYTWYVDDRLQAGETAATFSTSITDATEGNTHAIKVLVSDGSVTDDASAEFQVVP